jgi:hypothetical protein
LLTVVGGWLNDAFCIGCFPFLQSLFSSLLMFLASPKEVSYTWVLVSEYYGKTQTNTDFKAVSPGNHAFIKASNLNHHQLHLQDLEIAACSYSFEDSPISCGLMSLLLTLTLWMGQAINFLIGYCMLFSLLLQTPISEKTS